MSGNVHVRLREKVDGNGLVVPHSRLQWGLLFFFWGVCQYDLNEVRGFASDIRWAFLCGSQRPGGFVRAINPSGRRRLVVGGPAELSEKGSLVCQQSNEPRRTLRRPI
ncbi:hypothetical protein IEQ34_023288 [Dendrobium chrysotoxum]|uniref:Uncharacterized protein n=1 Tax=Dendrobium chrysotoxum TaxID=161865 RepID=A0AAV7FWU6_DENCH|nr:hypothetical protein IEQ34_023288 [Dendrobium chrysotoxum]